MAKSYLEQQISRRRERLVALDKERMTLIVEIAAYEDALAHMGEGVTIVSGESPPLTLSKAWVKILLRLSKFASFDAGDVEVAARELGFELTAVNVRSQLSTYNK